MSRAERWVRRLRWGLVVVVALPLSSCNLGPDDVPPIHSAIGRGDTEELRRLLAEEGDPEAVHLRQTALQAAVVVNSAEAVRLLLSAGATIKDWGPGQTLLVGTAKARFSTTRQGPAAEAASLAIAEALLGAGADPCPRSIEEVYRGLRASEVAAKDGRLELAEFLRRAEVACT